jgi:hypothetical protein
MTTIQAWFATRLRSPTAYRVAVGPFGVEIFDERVPLALRRRLVVSMKARPRFNSSSVDLRE